MSWMPKKTVVVPFDFSDKSIPTLDTALELAADASGIHVIHVLPTLEPTEPGVIWSSIDNSGRIHHAEEAIKKQLSDAKYQEVNVDVEIGDPGHEVSEYAKKVSAELIVLPSHGRTGIKRWLIGSVAERIVRLAHCPVLVLRD